MISDYITQRVMSANESEGQNGNLRPEDALYTFVCRQRFEGLEEHMQKIRKLVADPKLGSKAG